MKIIRKLIVPISFIFISFSSHSQDNIEFLTHLQFDSIGYFACNGLAPIMLKEKLNNQKWGYINVKGEIVIEPQFSEAKRFSDIGLAAVKQNDKYGYINEFGKFVIPPIYRIATTFSNTDGIAIVSDENNNELLINELGDVVLNAKIINNCYGWFEFSEGLVCIRNKKGLWGFIDQFGNTVIDFKYKEGSIFYGGIAYVDDGNTKYFIDKKGNIVDKPEREMPPLNCNSSHKKELDSIKLVSRIDRNDFKNSNTNKYIQKEFSAYIYYLHFGLASVKKGDAKSGKWGLIKIVDNENLIKQYVSNKIEEWQQKGKYEKTDDYIKRVNGITRDKKAQELTQEAINYFALKNCEFNQPKTQYDPDNEAFKIEFTGLNPIYLTVPILEAELFDENISNIKYSDFKFTLNENKEFALLYMKANNPINDKEYIYNSQDNIAFNVTKLNLNFKDIDINIKKESTSLVNETSNKLDIGSSSVDVNIPVNSLSNNNTFAVVIGNEDYQHEIKVDFAKNDASTFQKYLIKTLGVPDNQVHLIENATLGDLLHELDWLNKVSKGYNGEAKVIFYYAGHGMPDQSTKEAYLVPVDGYSSNTRTAIKLDEVYKLLGEYPTKSTTVFLDACFSGSSRQGTLASGRGVTVKPKEQIIKNNMVVFSAVSGDETAHPFTEENHGLFTFYLLKKLQDTKGDVSLGELQDYVSSNVLKKSVVSHKEQNPTVKSDISLKDTWRNWKLK